jgi:hypothetical protein
MVTSAGAFLEPFAVEDPVPPVDMVAVRYHTVEGATYALGDTYTITTTAGVVSTLIACQFADLVGVTEPPAYATGAIAGSPGTWDPPGSVAPVDLAAMSGVVATPTTKWLTGQHMILGDATHCNWNGSQWDPGDAVAAADHARHRGR